MIFNNEFSDDYRLADVTDEIIKQAESKLKVELPIDYIHLMKVQNSGELINRKLVIEDEVIAVDYLNGIGHQSGEGILLPSSTKRE